MPGLTPLDRFLQWEAQTPDRIFLRQPFKGSWKEWTWKQAGDEARRIAAALQGLGIRPGDHVSLLSKNCAHWIMADLAIMMAGCVSIPLYPTLSSHSLQPIITHSDSKAIIVGKLDDYAEQKQGFPAGLPIISVGVYGVEEALCWENIIATTAPLALPHRWNDDDIFTIVYTSGTTGKAKGVMHKACTFGIVLEKVAPLLGIPHNPVMFSYLPLSHIAERLAVEVNVIFNNGTIAFAESLETFAANLAETQPHAFFAVPRIWAKFREGILKKLPQKKLDLLLSIPIINGIIKKKIRKGLGLSRADILLSAAAPLSIEILLWYQKVGLTIYQVLGMTEDSVYGHFNRKGANKYGSVGQALEGLQVKISDEGELRVKSPGNFVGYYKEPELSAESFDEEGYMRTGDKAEYDKDGYLFITGRIKDLFKTDKGKYIAPTPIELQLMVNKDIEQCCVVGMGIPQPIALINLSEQGRTKPREELVAGLTDTLKEVNAGLEHHEVLEKIVVLSKDWTVENGLMTPTLKVKRNEVEKIYLPRYPQWYKEKGKVVFFGE